MPSQKREEFDEKLVIFVVGFFAAIWFGWLLGGAAGGWIAAGLVIVLTITGALFK